jgi:predicted aspartyl protease
MGRIIALVKIENLTDQDAKIRYDALVDTGASYMVLPSKGVCLSLLRLIIENQ